MTTSTYSFADVNLTASFAGVPAYVMNGKGIGEITISPANDNSMHDVAADGSVMVTKRLAANATMAITIQQTSPLNHWLLAAFNLLVAAPTSSWASGEFTIASIGNSLAEIKMKGVSFVKPADSPFKAQGSLVTWNLLVAELNGQALAQQIVQAAIGVTGLTFG